MIIMKPEPSVRVFFCNKNGKEDKPMETRNVEVVSAR